MTFNSFEYHDKHREDWIQGLRDFADLLENNPTVPCPTSFYPSHNITIEDSGTWDRNTGTWTETTYHTEDMKRVYKNAARAILLSGYSSEKVVPEKDDPYGDFRVKVHFGQFDYTVSLDRERTCRKVQVGTEILPAEPQRIIEAKPERVVEKYEWICDDDLVSLLKP